MKALKGLVIAIVLVLVASTSFAADSATLNIQANVQGTCSFAAASALLDFTNIDPTSGAPAIAATSIDYSCTNGVAYTLTLPPTATIANGVNTIGVNLAYTDNGTTTGTGLATTIDIDGTIPFANYSASPAGLYTGTVTLDVSP
ncbi:MAG: hypothetical protein C0623_10115 [Desulfuromonas sp.]|nr:MAG: hypothetical protein C0623_10115 [Desulfuromonas sp.]